MHDQNKRIKKPSVNEKSGDDSNISKFEPNSTKSPKLSLSSTSSHSNLVNLQVIPVRILCEDDDIIVTNALLDSASDICMVTESIMKKCCPSDKFC